jgi:hypothetical protein
MLTVLAAVRQLDRLDTCQLDRASDAQPERNL